MKRQIGKKTVDMDGAALQALRLGYARVLVDIGTGDGRFAYGWAGEHPETLCIGVDAVAEALIEMSYRASRKPARGGRANVLYVVAAVEGLPPELTAIADSVTVNYPWGSLLAGLVEPVARVLTSLRAVARDDATLTVLFNMSVFADEAYVERLGLSRLDDRRVDEILRPAYRRAGFEIAEFRPLAPEEISHRTTWGQHLTIASRRATALLSARAVTPA